MITFSDGQISTDAIIAAETAHVWKIIIDTQSWPLWGPSVSAVECADRFITARSHGRLRTPFGIWVPFTITDFEDGHFWGWRIGRLDATGHRVTRNEDNQTVLSFTMPWWSVPYLIICNRALHNIGNLAASSTPQ